MLDNKVELVGSVRYDSKQEIYYDRLILNFILNFLNYNSIFKSKSGKCINWNVTGQGAEKAEKNGRTIQMHN